MKFNRGNIARLKESKFKDPENMRFPLTVVVALQPGEDPMTKKGDMMCLTPLEVNHALIIRIAEAIATNESDHTIKMWKRVLKTVTMRFQIIDPKDTHWMAVRLRVDHTKLHGALHRTSAQRVQDRCINVKVCFRMGLGTEACMLHP